MKIAIISDIHDHIPNLRRALDQLRDCDELICCGDLCSPFIVKELGQGFQGSIHVVFGNNDGDLYRITEAARRFDQMDLYGEFVELELDGKRFGVNHFDNLGRALARSDRYDVVCFGHNHQFEITPTDNALIINPGEIYGGLTGDSTCVRYDTDSGEAARVDIQE